MRYKYIFIMGLFWGLLNSFQSWGQTDKNFVRTSVIKSPGVTEAEINDYNNNAAGEGKNKTDILSQIQFVDGLGRPIQSIIKENSPDGFDVISFSEYDKFGRQPKAYLPFTTQTTNAGFQDDVINQQLSFYTAMGFADDAAFAYSTSEFEDSPMNRIISQTGAGEAWYSNNRKVSSLQRSNNADDAVRIWNIGTVPTDVPQSTAIFNDNELIVSETTDEENKLSLTFTDKTGKTILKKVQSEENAGVKSFYSTYYVYDDFGNLRYVLPPKAVEILEGNGFVINSNIENLVFRYVYDLRKRMITKQIPGAGEVHMIYDNLDRLVLSQDANQKASNEWAFTKYDILSRPIITGIFTDPDGLTRDELQGNVDGGNSSDLCAPFDPAVTICDENSIETSAYREGVTQYIAGNYIQLNEGFEVDYTITPVVTFDYFTHTTSSSWYADYTDNNFPEGFTNWQPLAYSYYDSYIGTAFGGYDFITDGFGYTAPTSGFNGTDSRLMPLQNNERIKGALVASKVRILDSDQWLTTVLHYDNRGNVIQSIADNHLGGKDITTSQFYFDGLVAESLSVHQKPGNSDLTIKQKYAYDHAGRVLQTTQSINGQAEEVIASHDYNELGQSIKKSQGGDLDNGIQDIDYKYNIRGWLTDINDVASLGADDLFAMHLDYENGDGTDQFNGNISSIKWKSAGDNLQRQFNYTYDDLNRLTDANYAGGNAFENFNVEGINYDANGNIKSLKRYGLLNAEQDSYGLIDELQYKYENNQTSNRLTAVTDLANLAGQANDFKDGKDNSKKATSGEYTYDANGNLIADANKGIVNIDYNLLNLPAVIDFGNGKRIEYIYDAAGIKLQKKVTENSNTKVTDYVGGFIYEEGTLALVHTAEGRALPEQINGKNVTDGTFEYEYHIKDHLGNLRAATSERFIQYQATMETNNAEVENEQFGNIDNTRITGIAHNGTAASLIRADQTGPSKTIIVKKGDEVEATAWALYFPYGSDNTFTYGSTNINNPNEGQSNIQGSVVNTTNGSTDAPVAYLKMVFTPEGSSTSIEDTVRVTTNSEGMFSIIGMPFTAEEDGELTIFVYNVSGADVIFDDLLIKQQQRIAQENHYYPFGMNLVGIESKGSPDHKFQYNGKEKQEEFDLNWSDYGARMYDAQLGRFFTQDRYSGKYMELTPYQYGANNPIKYIDVNGDSLWISFGEDNKNKVLYQDGELLNADGSQYKGEGVKITKKGNQRITNSFLRSAVRELGSIAKYESKSGTNVVATLQNSENNFTIAYGVAHFDPGTFDKPYLFANQATSKMVNETGLSMLPFWDTGNYDYDPLPSNKSGSGGIIYFSGNYENGVSLGHELFHAYDANTGDLIINPIPDARTHINGTVIGEIRAATFANGIRSRFGIPFREEYQKGGHKLIDSKRNPIEMIPAEINK